MKRYTARELRGMTMRALEEHIAAEQLGVKTSKSTTKAYIAKRILARYAALDVDALAVNAGDATPAADREPVNPAFEQLCQEPVVLEAEVKETRGGYRPGAGRPAGMTAEKALYNRLSDQPHPAIKEAFELLFDAWATAAKCPAIALTKEDAVDIALPWTNVLEIMGVADKIPPWITVAITCAWNTLNTVKIKARLAREANRTKADIPERTV